MSSILIKTSPQFGGTKTAPAERSVTTPARSLRKVAIREIVPVKAERQIPINFGAKVARPLTKADFAGGDYDPVAPAIIAAIPVELKMALCQMSRQVWANAVYWGRKRQREIEGCQVPMFTRSDFVKLRELGLAELRDGERYHALTGRGDKVAMLCAKASVREFQIHAPWIGGSVGASTTLRCTCGWTAGLARGSNMQLKAAGAHSQHLAALKTGGQAYINACCTHLRET